MAWWRRDPSLWARTPAHRHAQRVLRDHEAALRTRCFSRTPANTAQHQDHDSTSRPDGMTDQEWSQLQRYRRWRKILQEHPYKGLFGASEDMLRGKGLTDWEWVYKSFPKWMLQEVDPQELANEDKSASRNDRGRRYGERSEMSSQVAQEQSVERKPTFAQPARKTTHYERDEIGVVSPSDLRRPRDASHVKVVGTLSQQEISETTSICAGTPMAKDALSKLDLEQQSTTKFELPNDPVNPETTYTEAKEASKRESSFIDAFFADEPRSCNRDLENSKSWRQTALQRRAPSNSVTSATDMASALVREAFVIPSSQALVDNYPYPRPHYATNSTPFEGTLQLPGGEVKPSMQESGEVVQEAGEAGVESNPTPSTSSKLRSLPKDDIDFLSAEEIRAAMGRRKSGIKSSEERIEDRQELETDYATMNPRALDKEVESDVLNRYHVHRTLQEHQRDQAAPKRSEPNNIEIESTSSLPQSEPVQIESSIDRMRRWIEEGGTSLAKHFWQDPIETGAPSEADMQFAKQMAGLGKSRRAREHISDDLGNDLPMSKGLLDRLKNDENRVEHAIYLLRTPRKFMHDAEVSKNLRVITERRLRNTYERTEKQFEAACQALRDLDAETIQKATNAFKRRLGIASRVLHKNHTLTRMLAWSAQARLDDPDLERSNAGLYNEILTRLATLRDTQLGLARLLDHAIQIYGVSLKPADEALSRPAPTSEIEAAEAILKENAAASEKSGARFLADTAAAARLTDEIESQKMAMKGLSDDGYARPPKYVPRRTFEDKDPLAHSLFRPFNLQLEGLGKKTEGEEAEERLKETSKQKMGDRKLVQEVRSAYEDAYGPITVEHRHVPQLDESIKAETREVEELKMLKDDPVDQAGPGIREDGSVGSTSTIEQAPVQSETKDAKAALDSPAACVASDAAVVETSSPSTPAMGEVNNKALQDSLYFAEEAVLTENSTSKTSTINLSTHYTILVHDPQTDALSITTSTSGPPRDTSPALPIHQALSLLKAPAKFVPYISPGLEIVTVKRHMLILRDALDETSSTRGFETISAQPSVEKASGSPSSEVNPIDGTTRLSPTGYSGVEQNREQVERDFEERRQAAAATEAASSKRGKQHTRDEELPRKRRGGVGGVVKTAIWASAVCYIVGVTAELLR